MATLLALLAVSQIDTVLDPQTVALSYLDRINSEERIKIFHRKSENLSVLKTYITISLGYYTNCSTQINATFGVVIRRHSEANEMDGSQSSQSTGALPWLCANTHYLQSLLWI
jgi:hypothetical protein